MNTLHKGLKKVAGHLEEGECTALTGIATALNLPELDEEKLAQEEANNSINNEWSKEAGSTLYKCEWFLERTTGNREKEFGKKRAEVKREVSKIKKEAEKRGVDWERVAKSAFISRIQHCPLPDPEKPVTTSISIQEMQRIVSYLTTCPHHRKEEDGDPKVPLYRWANTQDEDTIKREKVTNGRPPIGCRRFECRWLYPNLNPLTGGKTAYQEAVEVNFGNLLAKYRVMITKVHKQEVLKLEKGGIEKLKGILEENPGERYFVKSQNGHGALLVRAFYQKFHGRDGKDGNEIFVISIVEAVGECRDLKKLAGYYIPIWDARKGTTPRNAPEKIRDKLEKFTKIMKLGLWKEG